MDIDNIHGVHSKIEGAMAYPSTTQALFALIVMIIVLLFILVYCCWGTFSCARQDETTNNADEGGAVVREIQGPGGRGHRMVIVPFSNMIYVGDPESHRIYEIPVEQDKPPAYTEVFEGAPPPPYSTGSQGSETSSNENANNAARSLRPRLPDLPPSYDDCLSTTQIDNKWPEVLEALVSERAKQELQQSSQTQSKDTLITQLPPIRMPTAMLTQNEIPTLDPTTTPLQENISVPLQDGSLSQSTTNNQNTEHGENAPSPAATNLLDLWSPPPPFPEPSPMLSSSWNQNLQGENNMPNSAISSSQPPSSALPTNNHTLTTEADEVRKEEEDTSLSSATDEDVSPSPSTSTTTDSININVNQEPNRLLTQNANSHSMQDYSNV